ncbi:hypothetical protein J6590_090573 [Homalodisca vitripennis]|nr:hypothetical protein J6590_090573 [Homalodisca vitripennis]
MTVIGGEHGVEEVSRGTASSTGGRVRTRTASRDKTTTRRSDTRHRHKTRKVRQSRRHTPSALMVDPHHASILRPSAPGPETRRRLSQHLRLPGKERCLSVCTEDIHCEFQFTKKMILAPQATIVQFISSQFLAKFLKKLSSISLKNSMTASKFSVLKSSGLGKTNRPSMP